ERITPWRHLIPAAGDRAQESIALLRRKFPQVEGALRSLHARTMTGRAIDRKQLCALADLIRCEALRICGAGHFAHQQKTGSRQCNGCCANEEHDGKEPGGVEQRAAPSERLPPAIATLC